MRRVAVALVATITGLVLLLQFKVHPTTGVVALAAGPTPTTRSSTVVHPRHHHLRPAPLLPSSHPATSPAQTPSSTPSSHHQQSITAAAPKTIVGQTVQTAFGPVQVRIVETAGRLTDITALQVPNDNSHSAQIAAVAVPILRTEALRANSARIDVVSGATYTSDGYAQSLQSALDKA